MEKPQFEKWIDFFIQHKQKYHPDKTVALIMDGHSSHLSVSVALKCLDNKVSVLKAIYLIDNHDSEYVDACLFSDCSDLLATKYNARSSAPGRGIFCTIEKGMENDFTQMVSRVPIKAG
jgi:hypothetical protein